jgi:hypothetical protein
MSEESLEAPEADAAEQQEVADPAEADTGRRIARGAALIRQ